MATFSYRITPPRADFVATITPGEMALMGAHFGYLQGLQAKGVLRFVGRAANGDFGIVVYEAETRAEAEALAHADPAVAGGLVGVEVHDFVIVDFG